MRCGADAGDRDRRAVVCWYRPPARHVVPGSYFAASHGATETLLPHEQATSMERAYDQRTMTGSGKPRTREEFARLFAGWDVVEPGLVWLPQWRPDEQVPAEMVADPTISGV